MGRGGIDPHVLLNCTLDGAMNVSVSCLQLCGGVEWRQNLDTQRGALLANELRNNACKLAKCPVQAVLARTDQINFGYVELL